MRERGGGMRERWSGRDERGGVEGMREVEVREVNVSEVSHLSDGDEGRG